MITETELREAGYHAHPWQVRARHRYAARLFQKWIRHDIANVKLFAINFFEYPKLPDLGLPEVTYSPEARLYLPSSNGGGFDVCLHERLASVPEVETFFMRCYVGLGCGPDPHNQE